jgi:hypothetical protein
MYIRRNTADLTYTLDLNEDEYKVMRKIIDKLVFNPDGVSNYFKVTDGEVKIVDQMRNSLNHIR